MAANQRNAFEVLRDLIPATQLKQSGVVFNSGRNAFSGTRPLYILGLNPGGGPDDHQHETLESHTQAVSERNADWSSFRDQSLKGKPPGTFGFQPRVLHLLDAVQQKPSDVPASNLIFVRTKREKNLDGRLDALAEESWQFHETAIRLLGVKVVLCFGQTAAHWVRRRLDADPKPVATFTETNERRWTSSTYYSPSRKISIVAATHPSIAKWTVEATDPSRLVRDALAV
ncbi:hypothetical protein [Caenimonas sp. SL110]|uniref:hypothetical protein n=1 Tax=Caenimonas sp. SL110 TaxID=1450524 RepID=UPI00128BA3D5|nr:hypothetical protein [Caenimonas sp. SL110]